MSVELVIPSNHLILCHPLLLLPSIFPSIRVFFNKSVLRIRWPKDWSFSINPSNEYSGLISFSMDWLGLLAVHGTHKSLLQHHSSKASILPHSAFFTVQLYPLFALNLAWINWRNFILSYMLFSNSLKVEPYWFTPCNKKWTLKNTFCKDNIFDKHR